MFLEIDKKLSNEIFKHYNYFNYLKRLYFSNTYSFKLESLLNEYLHDKTSAYRHPLIIHNQTKVSSDDPSHNEKITCFNILMSKWLNKLMESNLKKNDSNALPSIIYRYCNHSILSADLTTLLQSILHQLCYIIEIHESCAFDVSHFCLLFKFFRFIINNFLILFLILNSFIKNNCSKN